MSPKTLMDKTENEQSDGDLERKEQSDNDTKQEEKLEGIKKEEQSDDDAKINKEFVETLQKHLPYYFDPIYDDPDKRRDFRDGFIRYTVERILAAAEWKRDTINGETTAWTAAELYCATLDFWVRIVSLQFHEDGWNYGNIPFMDGKLLMYQLDDRNMGAKHHFITEAHFDQPTLNRTIPFDFDDFIKVLNSMTSVDQVEDSISNHIWLDLDMVEKMYDIMELKWAELVKIQAPEKPNSDQILSILLGTTEDKKLTKLLYGLRITKQIVKRDQITLAEFLIHCNPLYNMSKHTKPLISESKSGKMYHAPESSRIVVDHSGRPYAPELIDAIPDETRRLIIASIQSTGIIYAVKKIRSVWGFVTSEIGKPVTNCTITGYRLRILPPKITAPCITPSYLGEHFMKRLSFACRQDESVCDHIKTWFRAAAGDF